MPITAACRDREAVVATAQQIVPEDIEAVTAR